MEQHSDEAIIFIHKHGSTGPRLMVLANKQRSNEAIANTDSSLQLHLIKIEFAPQLGSVSKRRFASASNIG